jgi:hypothetical protein
MQDQPLLRPQILLNRLIITDKCLIYKYRDLGKINFLQLVKSSCSVASSKLHNVYSIVVLLFGWCVKQRGRNSASDLTVVLMSKAISALRRDSKQQGATPAMNTRVSPN